MKKLRLKWLFTMALRDARASKTRLLLFMSSLVLGIAAVVAIQLFSTNLKANLRLQSKALMGADYIIDSYEIPTDRAQEIIDSLKPNASEVTFVSMAAFPENSGTKLVKVRGMEGDFPFYGSMDTQPVAAARNYQKEKSALVDATLMLQYNIKAGDSIKIGELTLPIAGALTNIPGATTVSTSVAPSVIIPKDLIEQTQLLQFGSRKEYQYFFKAADTLNLDRLEDELEPQLDLVDADLDTHTSTSRRLGRRYDNISKFLNLVAFIALILGCIGIVSSIQIYIKEKLASTAVLKCLGTSSLQSFLIYLIQVAAIGFMGGLLGTIIGVGLQSVIPYFLEDFLPFAVQISIDPISLIVGILLGILMSVLFAVLPLLSTWFVSPLRVLRVDDGNLAAPKTVQIAIYFVVVATLFLISYWLLENFIYALFFIGGTAVTFIVLAGVGLLLMRIIRKKFPRNWGYPIRQALMNLFRPNNQTLVLITSIGLGAFLVSTLFFTRDLLLQKTDVEQSASNPNLIILDVQTDQRAELKSIMKQNGIPVLDDIPIVTMRMSKINSRSVDEIERDTTREVRGWVLNHEFRTTYRSELTASENIVEGSWQPTSDASETIPISISENVAHDALLEIGDEVTFNVQGVMMPTQITSIRSVDWSQLQPNFNILFPAGVLENAPQFNVVTTAVADEAASARLQSVLVSRFPNLTIIDLRQAFILIKDILEKVSWVINFMALFSMLTGIIVLIGSVRTSKYQRIKESVLLRTIGARDRQILKISALEYVFLGLLGSLVGVLLAVVATLGLALFVFQEAFVPSWIPFLIIVPGITLIVVIIGLSNIREVLGSSPLEVLRKTN